MEKGGANMVSSRVNREMANDCKDSEMGEMQGEGIIDTI